MGEIAAIPLRGAWTGNRGILHSGREIVRFHASDLWITYALEFRGRWHEQWQPHHYTFLYFHDEAVSFAAGHRPCAECRRDSYEAYRSAWADRRDTMRPSAKEINRQLHGERIVRGTHRRRLHDVPWLELPDGAFVWLDGAPRLVLGKRLVEWTCAGYGAARVRPIRGSASAITPPSTVPRCRPGISHRSMSLRSISRPSSPRRRSAPCGLDSQREITARGRAREPAFPAVKEAA